MNPQQRQALADLLARLVADGEITEERAIQIYLSVADDGSLLDNALPLPPYEGIANPPPDEDWPGVLWLLLANAIGLPSGRAGVPQVIDFAPLTVRMAAADQLQDWHTDAAMQLARDLSAGRLAVATFQRELRALNNQHNAAQVMLGAGSRYQRMAAALTEQLTLQAAFLQRFADQIGGRLAATRAGIAGLAPFSLGQLADRAALYGGIGRALFFQSFEAQRQIDTGAGWVIYYQARDDDRTCIVKGEKVIAECGERPIEELSIGDRVLTGQGRNAAIVAIYEKQAPHYRVIQTAAGSLKCTGDHPILVRRGQTTQWLDAAEIRPGDHVFIQNGMQPTARGIGDNHTLRNSFDIKASGKTVAHLDRVALHAPLTTVPIATVNLQQQIGHRNEEIKNILTNCILALELNSGTGEELPRYSLNRAFVIRSRFSVASKRAVAATIPRRCNAKGLSARLTILDDWRPPAFLRTISARMCVAVPKRLTASLTDRINGAARYRATFARAVVIPVCSRFRDGEVFPALRAGFRDGCRRLLAFLATVPSLCDSPKDLARLKLCWFVLPVAVAAGQDARSNAPRLPLFERSARLAQPRGLFFLGELVSKNVDIAAPVTSNRVCFHDSIIPRRVIASEVISNQIRQESATVYDLVLDEDHTFFANGILVHNCSPCHNAQGYYLPGQGPYPGQICLGRHHCRCRRITIYDPARYAQLTGLPTVGTAVP